MTKTAAASSEKTLEKRNKSVVREYIEAIAIALALALFVRAFIVQAFKIPSGSMEETLLVGDHILVNKFLYWIRAPHRGDVIVFRFPKDESRDFIKRIVGLPGEVVMVRGKNVYINCPTPDRPERCKPIKESYAVFKPAGVPMGPEANWGPKRIPPGRIMVMGDNRNNSHDSRAWGFLEMGRQLDHIRLSFAGWDLNLPFPCSLWSFPCWDGKIRGVAFLIYWSWDSDRGRVRWSRIGKSID